MDSGKNFLHKTPTGIKGLDEITNGGLPTGRTTLVCGSAGSGKTILAMEFLVHGVLDHGEPGVFMAFEETGKDLAENFASFGYDLEQLQRDGKLVIDYVSIERSEIEETGEYDLEGLFIRLGDAVDTIKAKRVVLDTIEVLFAGLRNDSIIRAELRRLFRWLKNRGLTAIVTGERGEGLLSRYGLEEYVADCVILLDHRVNEQLSTRRLRIVKYRGTLHGADEYPFLMAENGISVLPLTSVGLTHEAPTERISSGSAELDEMLGGKGFFRGSSILVSGTAGTGKSSLAMTYLTAACERGEQSLYLGFEESKDQIIRNMASIGLDLRQWVDKGLLHLQTVRPSSLGLEGHLASILQIVKQVKPKVVVFDPITTFVSVAEGSGMRSMLTRLVDFLKMQQISAMFTHLSTLGDQLETTSQGVSSIMDVWLLLRDVEDEGRRSSALYVLKSRGMAHSREMRDFILTDRGIRLGDNYIKGLNSTNRAEQERSFRQGR
ncbi:MAG: KaiC 1 [Acidobacteria bacterium]|nr:MAG: KaiC 1 [Acidobacteriota bacterium]